VQRVVKLRRRSRVFLIRVKTANAWLTAIDEFARLIDRIAFGCVNPQPKGVVL